MEIYETIMLLSLTKGVGKKTLNKINIKELYDLTESTVWEYIELLSQKYARVKPEKDKIKRVAMLDKIKKTIEDTRKNNIEIIIKNQRQYPESFLDLDDAPLMFYAQGNIDALKHESIAVIGTRNVSALGDRVGFRFGEFFAEQGYATVSGLASGCDTAGHTGTLSKNGITIAILPTPLNDVYPKSNAKLKEKILKSNGCIVSEYPVGAFVSKANFIERDRLQYALALGVVAIETGVNGGSMHAINGAISLGKPVGCFEYSQSHYNEYSYALGNKMLIDKGMAIPLKNTDSIMHFLKLCHKYEYERIQKNDISLF